MRRWLRFNAVGLAGAAIQLAALKTLHEEFGLHYLLATALAVELAVLHNFGWHWKWTFGERQCPPARLLHFQCTTGLVSIVGNLFGMEALAGILRIPLTEANLLTIAMMYAFNFVISDRYVFRLR